MSSGCGCKEVYRFLCITYFLLLLYLLFFLQQHPYFFVHKKNFFLFFYIYGMSKNVKNFMTAP